MLDRARPLPGRRRHPDVFDVHGRERHDRASPPCADPVESRRLQEHARAPFHDLGLDAGDTVRPQALRREQVALPVDALHGAARLGEREVCGRDVTFCAGVAVWIPPIVDQSIHDPGNFSILLDTFRAQTDEVIGLRRGAHIWLTQLDPVGNWLLGTRRIQGSVVGGAALLVAWAAAAAVAWRQRHRDLVRLNLVLAVQSLCALYWARAWRSR